jgi:hypothetical protein
MLTQHRNDLVRFLTDSAHEAAASARIATGDTSRALAQEAEELMTLRARVLAHAQARDEAAQLQLPFEHKAAA